jgi:dGTPase
LNECGAEIGGFSHNRFALTIVEELELRYNGFSGLNLTQEVLAGQMSRADKKNPGLHRLLEVQLVDAADSVTYDAHDTDDAIKLKLVELGEMEQLALVQLCLERVRSRYASLDPKILRKAVVHELINSQVNRMVDWCAAELDRYDFDSATAAMQSDFLVQPDPELREQKQELEQFLYSRVYRHPRLVAVREEAQGRLRQMVTEYIRRPELIPAHYQPRLQKVGALRMAIEYVAGMTDHFCEQTWRDMFSEVASASHGRESVLPE